MQKGVDDHLRSRVPHPVVEEKHPEIQHPAQRGTVFVVQVEEVLPRQLPPGRGGIDADAFAIPGIPIGHLAAGRPDQQELPTQGNGRDCQEDDETEREPAVR